MKKNEPKYQHLVPRCYIKNFAEQHKKKIYRCGAMYWPQSDERPAFEPQLKNVKDFCGINHFYTLNIDKSINKMVIEDYYSKIESSYSPIYHKLVNPTVSRLTKREKYQLIKFIVSLKLRGLTYHNALNKLTEGMVDFAFEVFDRSNDPDKRNEVFDEKGELLFNFEGKTKGEAIAEHYHFNRQLVNIKTINHIRKVTTLLLDHAILISRTKDDFGYISSDNPVYLDGHGLYDHTSTWSLPINRYNLLKLLPRSKWETDNHTEILRHDSIGPTLLHNLHQIEGRFNWVFGYLNDLEIARKVDVNDEQSKKNALAESFTNSFKGFRL